MTSPKKLNQVWNHIILAQVDKESFLEPPSDLGLLQKDARICLGQGTHSSLPAPLYLGNPYRHCCSSTVAS